MDVHMTADVFPSPYGVIYFITHIPERPVFMWPFKVLYG